MRCHFEGSTGVAPSPDVVVGEGGVLVLDRCQLRTLQVGGRSTVLLIDCPAAVEIDAEAGCQVLRVDRQG